MARKIRFQTTPSEPQPGWHATHGTYIAGRAELDPVDALASEMETRWGAGRLRLLVPAELRERFDRQRYLLNQAIWYGDLETVRREARRAKNAWLALDRVARAAGEKELASSPAVHMEVTLDDGTVAVIVPSAELWSPPMRSGRRVVVYTLDEIGRILSHPYGAVSKAKELIPGTVVTQVRRSALDPLDAIPSSHPALDDPLPDFAKPDFGL